ncbi:hypothetical protein EON83_29905 [bacterium]|nr:MAG: hypothetical protein EON83_29905 [bacterium]
MKRQLLLLSLIAVLPLAAQAQPDLNNAPKGNNAPNWKPNANGRFGQNFNLQDLLNRKPMTPEQLKQIQAQQEEQRLLMLRQRLTREGFTDVAVQDAIVDFAKEKEVARVKLQTQWTELDKSTHKADLTDAQIAGMLNDFQAKADDERARREMALQQLSTKIELEQKPRLKLLLMTMGLIGDEASLVKKDAAGGIADFAGLGGLAGIGGLNNLLEGLGNNAQVRIFNGV